MLWRENKTFDTGMACHEHETRQVADQTTKKSTSRAQRYRLKEAVKSEK